MVLSLPGCILKFKFKLVSIIGKYHIHTLQTNPCHREEVPHNTNHKSPGLKVMKLENSLKLKRKRNDWLLLDTSASSQSLHFILSLSLYTSASSQSLRFILCLRMNSSFITSRPGRHLE